MRGHCVCGKTWVQRGSQTGHCVTCHETFSSERGFEDHRTGSHDPWERVCVYPGDLLDREGASRYSASPDATGTLVWRSTRENPFKNSRGAMAS